ncbi:MAG: response regulator [Parcubacteria group bacterium CG08_land_8_20_14_0_20_43_9]|nr:MAG: response regulator [Parcubacteria group bacterium CG08_land_8_20_14_0_20_43_9]
MQEHILIIEDDKFLRELISRKLLSDGFKIEEAIDGEEGLRKIEEVKPDLILLDLILPGLDGFEVLERIKDNPSTSAVPVLILSNLGQRDEIERGLKLGAVDFLVKAHFTPEEIVDKIKIIFEKRPLAAKS